MTKKISDSKFGRTLRLGGSLAVILSLSSFSHAQDEGGGWYQSKVPGVDFTRGANEPSNQSQLKTRPGYFSGRSQDVSGSNIGPPADAMRAASQYYTSALLAEGVADACDDYMDIGPHPSATAIRTSIVRSFAVEVQPQVLQALSVEYADQLVRMATMPIDNLEATQMEGSTDPAALRSFESKKAAQLRYACDITLPIYVEQRTTAEGEWQDLVAQYE
ncbi:hypothetical protein A3709_20055 [Halioglobus sp. HI00S01]|uniref:hypothetical protein n=1 Tax=Halioglobus sp. HI00S01 TaxID=1822214 RepID=UPI0007C32CBD|nr:hypothetical protein [Halioglobus sp. HI00S01]KZX57920.1 hypothetical protein A3709_20055 [Halioglobus sp. HI00S01]